jgi:hypothetical protein
MNILVNGDLILLHFPVGRSLVDSQIQMLVCLKTVASTLIYGGLEGFLFHLFQNHTLIDDLNDVRQQFLQGHFPVDMGNDPVGFR